MQIADKYSPQEIEQKWYDYWIDNRLFHSEPDGREPYTIVIPPPNVTGKMCIRDRFSTVSACPLTQTKRTL